MDDWRLLTWDTLEPYLRSRIAGARRTIGEIRGAFAEEEAEEAAICVASYRSRVLDPLEGFVPLVNAMRLRPSARAITPILSMVFLRLFRPSSDEVAWIEAMGEGRFRLKFVRSMSGKNPNTRAVYEGDLAGLIGHLEPWMEE